MRQPYFCKGIQLLLLEEGKPKTTYVFFMKPQTAWEQSSGFVDLCGVVVLHSETGDLF